MGLCLLPVGAVAQRLTVKISGIRNEKGLVRVSLFTDDESFAMEKPYYDKSLSKAGMQNGRLTIVFQDIPPGWYGVAVLDDEDENRKMGYRWLIPAEGFGFSDYILKKLRRPRFEEFRFEMRGADKTVEVALKYW